MLPPTDVATIIEHIDQQRRRLGFLNNELRRSTLRGIGLLHAQQSQYRELLHMQVLVLMRYALRLDILPNHFFAPMQTHCIDEITA